MLYPVQKVQHINFNWESTPFVSIEQITQKFFFNLEYGMSKEISQYAFDNPELSGLFTIKDNDGNFISQAFFSIDEENKKLLIDEVPTLYALSDPRKEILISLSEFIQDINNKYRNIDEVSTLREPGSYDFEDKLAVYGSEIILWKRDIDETNIFTLSDQILNVKSSKSMFFNTFCKYKYREIEITEENKHYLESKKFLNDFDKKSDSIYVDRLSGLELPFYEVESDSYFKLNENKDAFLKKGDFILRYPEWDSSISKEEFTKAFDII